MWTQNVLSFRTKYQPYLQMLLGIWQILKNTPPGAVIQGVIVRLGSLVLPCVFPAYKQLGGSPGCLFKTVKCVTLSKGESQPGTNPENQGTKNHYVAAPEEITKDMVSDRTDASKPRDKPVSGKYLGKPFRVEKEGNKVYVNGEMSYYISDRQWDKIRQRKEKCFKKEDCERSEKENEVLFVRGGQSIWQKVDTGKVMEFGEVLDDFIFENNDTLLISNDVWFLPVDLSEKSEGKFPKLLNLVGLFFSTHKKTSLLWSATSFSIASAILEIKPVRSFIYRIINKMFCRSVQYICNKLPYPVRRFVYLLLSGVENLLPRNDILLKVERRDNLDVIIGGSAKINSAQKPTRVPWLNKKEEGEEYVFSCGCSIEMKATYNNDTGRCEATMQHTSAVFPISEKRVSVKCRSLEEFRRIGTFLSCLATSKAGSLFKYDRNDNKVHVRRWRASLRDYVDAEFPKIYKLSLHDVIV